MIDSRVGSDSVQAYASALSEIHDPDIRGEAEDAVNEEIESWCEQDPSGTSDKAAHDLDRKVHAIVQEAIERDEATRR